MTGLIWLVVTLLLQTLAALALLAIRNILSGECSP